MRISHKPRKDWLCLPVPKIDLSQIKLITYVTYSPYKFKTIIYSLINISNGAYYYFHSVTIGKTNLRGYAILNAYAVFRRKRLIILFFPNTLLQQIAATGCARQLAFILLVGLKI